MADISQIKLPNNTVLDIKDAYAMEYPYQRVIDTRTYTDVIGTANDSRGGGFFYMKVRGTTYDTQWMVRLRVHATVPGTASYSALYNTDTIYEIWGAQNAYRCYSCINHIQHTSYRPIYYNTFFAVSQLGYQNGCGSWLGFSLYYSTNPTNASYKRTVTVDLLEYSDCTVEFQDTLITPDNIPNRAEHTNWYSNTNTSYGNFDACNQGLKQTGDVNTVNISQINRGNGNMYADSVIYRYQMLFHVDEDTLTPLNNNDNIVATTKTMLTNIEFDPFMPVYYYTAASTINAGAAISASYIALSYPFDLRYTFNVTATQFTAHKPLYLILTPTSDGKAKIASTLPLTQELPTSKDGYWYLYLGRMYSQYQLMLFAHNRVFIHNGTSVQQILAQDALATDDVAGLMSAKDKSKLDGIAEGASTDLYDMTGVLRTHPQSGGITPMMFYNDLAFLAAKGGSAIMYKDGVESGSLSGACFTGDPGGCSFDMTNAGFDEIVIVITSPTVFTWDGDFYIDFGSAQYRANTIKFELKNSSFENDDWNKIAETTTNDRSAYKVHASHSPVGGTGAGSGWNQWRITMSNFNQTTGAGFRIAEIGYVHYGSIGLRNPYMSRGIDDSVYRSITPAITGTYGLGSDSLRWNRIYANNFYGSGANITNLNASNLASGTIPAAQLPAATSSTLGGIKVGTNLSISNGVLSATDTTYSAATDSAAGLMSAADKTKLDGIATGATANAGTITGITMNGASKGTSGVVDLGTVLTAHQDISGKADKVSSSTNGNFAALDASGNLIDSGHKHSDYLTAHQDISGKANIASPTFTGTPAAPTADNGTNTTQIATTAFVQNAISIIPAASTTTAGLVKVGTNLSIDANGVLSSTDTNTHRPIQVKGTQILGNNTTALNFAEGDNITITNSSGTITISATDTNTKNTAGSTNTSSKIFLIGATSQAANPQTYSHDTCYIGTNGKLYSGGSLVLTEHQDISGKANDSAVVHLTGEETVTGTKTFSNSTKNPSIQFKSTRQSSATGLIMYLGTSDDNNDYSAGRFAFYQYSGASNGKSRTSYYDRYYLPTVAQGKSANNSYSILTTNGPAFLQLKEYSYAYTVSGNSSLEITNTNFGHSSPSGYTPVAVVRYNAGSTQVTVPHVGINIASSTIAFVVQNTKSSSVSATAKIAILYARTTAIV